MSNEKKLQILIRAIREHISSMAYQRAKKGQVELWPYEQDCFTVLRELLEEQRVLRSKTPSDR